MAHPRSVGRSRSEVSARLGGLRRLAGSAAARKADGIILAEGDKLCEEALGAGLTLKDLYLETARLRCADTRTAVLATNAGAEIWELKDGSLRDLGLSVTPQPLLGVFERPDHRLPPDARFVLVAAGVADPGNAGALLRCAEASGTDGVIFAGNSVDPFGPKAVRASAGSVFRLPVLSSAEPVAALKELKARNLRTVGTAPGRGLPYEQANLEPPLALVVGNETHGVPASWEDGIEEWAQILLDGQAESLNVGAAAAVLCFEVRRRMAAPAGDGSTLAGRR